jgi:hypothetical protein
MARMLADDLEAIGLRTISAVPVESRCSATLR